MTHKTSRCALSASSILLLLAPLTAHAQGDPWDDALAADHPGFSDATSTMTPRSIQVELGYDASKAEGAPVDMAVNALVRYGILDFLEARLEMPALGFSRALDGGEADSTQLTLDSVEAGAKINFPVTRRFRLAVLPALILPSGLSTSPYGGPGGSLGIIADVSLADHIGLTASVVPRTVDLSTRKTPSEYVFELDAALGGAVQLQKRVGLFAEGWVQFDNDFKATPGVNGGVITHITPVLMLDAYLGSSFPQTGPSPYAGLGFAYRYP